MMMSSARVIISWCRSTRMIRGKKRTPQRHNCEYVRRWCEKKPFLLGKDHAMDNITNNHHHDAVLRFPDIWYIHFWLKANNSNHSIDTNNAFGLMVERGFPKWCANVSATRDETT
jgi:hypothetical protein